MTAPAPDAAARSVLLAALGADAGRLHPQVRAYLAALGDTLRADGVFEAAGSRFGRLGLLARPVTGPGLLVTGMGRDVPFELEGHAVEAAGAFGVFGAGAGAGTAGGPGGAGTPGGATRMRRTLWFEAGPQSFGDVLVPGPEPGTVRNILGDAGRVELLLACAVTRQGWFRMRSVVSYVRLGRLRVRLPGALGVRAEVCNGYDAERERHTVAVRVRNPLLGTVLGYRGTFRLRPAN